ncbi:MAG: sugar diacid recognition domain-containing protein [Bacillota bacterium]
MNIVRELAAPIVERTMAVVGYNINIMNRSGVIVASGDSERIGTFHQGAAMVLKTDKPLLIDPSEVDKFPGARPGVNLPIRFREQTVGVVGITGHPETVGPYGELVRVMVELMLERAYYSEHVALERRARDHLVRGLISGQPLNVLEQQAAMLGFDLSIERRAVVVDVVRFKEYVKKMIEDTQKGELEVQRLKERILDTISEIWRPVKQSISGMAGADRFVVLDPSGDSEVCQYISRLIKRLQNDLDVRVVVGVGDAGHDLSVSYTRAMKALEASKRLNLSNPAFFQDLGAVSVFEDLPVHARETLIRQVLGPLAQDEYRHFLKTVQVYLECDLNMAKTAERLYVHRNTVRYRLQRVQKLTGKDLQRVKDASEVWLALQLHTYFAG